MTQDKLDPKYDLDLPEAPEWFSRPPKLSLAEHIARCEKLLPYWNKKREPLYHQKVVFEEFSLADPEPDTDTTKS